jgi:hypothetical protein
MLRRYLEGKRLIVLFLFFLIFGIGIYIFSSTSEVTQLKKVGSKSNQAAYEDMLDPVLIEQGKMLAVQHCKSCHMLPDPSLLDKENWRVALTKMGPLLGIFDHNGQSYPIYTDIDQSFYPSEAAMSSLEWQKILDYYTTKAPVELTLEFKKPVRRELPFFLLELPPPLFNRKGNTASFVKIDTSVKPHRVFVNRASSNTLFLLDDKLQVKDSLITDGPLVDIDFSGNELVTCKIGSNLFGNNSRNGDLTRIKINKQGNMRADIRPLFETLARPVQITSVDLNGDLRKDYLICEFGNVNGSLFWMENKGDEKYLRHDIRAFPGATKAHIDDYNKDGRPDIWVQFSQGEEGIFLFTNKGKGLFAEKQVIQFPPSYGSSSFELNDFNKDGFSDILYTCGDRGDGINQLKPYHGVYVFINNGKNVFSQQYFYPINGCIKAMTRDFDNDGDLDIAAIGFFTDNRHPEEGFTFLKNNGNLNFDPYSLPLKTKFYKSTTMDIADLDSDEKPDIILGHGFIGTKATDEIKPLFIVLKNRF